MKVKLWLCASLVGVVAAGVCAEQVQATPSDATSTILAQSVVKPINIESHGTTLAGRPWRVMLRTHGMSDGYVVDNKFGPGQTTGWHSHPGPSLIFVVAGTVTNYDSDSRGCAGRTYSAGSSFVDAGGSDVHMLRNDSAAPAETIAVQLIPGGQPRRIDESEPANCHV
jgi:quercetin dioxygenase-like cupin family protein